MKPVHVLIFAALAGVAALLYSLSGDVDSERDGRRSDPGSQKRTHSEDGGDDSKEGTEQEDK